MHRLKGEKRFSWPNWVSQLPPESLESLKMTLNCFNSFGYKDANHALFKFLFSFRLALLAGCAAVCYFPDAATLPTIGANPATSINSFSTAQLNLQKI